MALSQWDDDRALLAELGEALRDAREEPSEWVAAARGALAWRGVDAELALAELTFDSVSDAAPAGLTRAGHGAVRLLAFRGGEVVIEVEVSGELIVGQLSPGGAGQVTVQTAAGEFDRTPVDPEGFFTLRTPPPGPARLHARTGSYAVATSWVCLT